MISFRRLKNKNEHKTFFNYLCVAVLSHLKYASEYYRDRGKNCERFVMVTNRKNHTIISN